MNLPQIAIRQRVTTVMASACLVFLGTISLFSLHKELFPPLAFPQVTVVTDYVNAAPEEIETLITRPLEEAISSTSGLRKLESVSQEGKSTIFASFGWKENIDFAALSVREKIDLVKERLPKESDDPVVLKFDPLARPVMILSVTGDLPPVDLKILTERILKENLEKVSGVASATVSGGADREIQVELDQGRLQSAEVSLLSVIDAIDNANISYPAGSIKKGLYEYLIRTVGEYRTVPEIAYTVVATDVKKKLRREPDTFLERGEEEFRRTLETLREEQKQEIGERKLILVRDIGEVKDSFKERTSISRYNGKENIAVSIQKQGSANSVEVARRIRRELLFLQEELESRGMKAEVIFDHSEFIVQAIASVRNAAILGGGIASAVLFFFFRNWFLAFMVALSIPISITGTFFLCRLHGITINMMSMGGLALGAGMMVDNSIVVVENIFRLREQGLGKDEASVQGTTEVFWPIVSSTLTTMAVFAPLILFVPGVAGQLFKDLSWTVIYSLVISFFVSVTLVPMLAVYVEAASGAAERAVRISGVWIERLKKHFANMSEGEQNLFFLQVCGASFAVFIVSIFVFLSLDREVMPKVDQGQFLIRVDLPVGSTLSATDDVVKMLEEETRQIPEVETVSAAIGSAQSAKPGEVTVETLRAYQGLVFVGLKHKRHRSSREVVSDLKERLERYDLAKAEIEFVLEGGEFEFAAGGGKPIEIEVKGYEIDKLAELSGQVEKMLAQISGISEILSDAGASSPETKVEVDRKRSALYAISARDISLTAKAAIEGAVATVFKEAGREVDVRVRLEDEDRKKIEQLGDLLVHSNALDIPVPLKEVARIAQGFGPSEIRRRDQIRAITVRANIEKGFQQKKVLDEVDKRLNTVDLPKDYNVELVGKAREVKESFRRVAFAILLALILNYMIMAAQFESFLHPIVIMGTVPLAMIGVAAALWLTLTPVSIIALLGILILAGTIVNNAIVLVDFINQSRRQGVELVEASVTASVVRFRPIIMSALTTVVGLIPLALGIGEGAEIQAPLAIAMIGGLVSATVLTLCVIPSLYVLVVRAVDGLFGEI